MTRTRFSARTQPRRSSPALENGDLVAQDKDLGLFGTLGPGEQGKPAECAEQRKVRET